MIKIKEILCYLTMLVVNRLKGIDKNKFFFIGMGGNYCDNARAVSERLHERYPDSNIYWFFNSKCSNNTHIPKYVHPVTSLSSMYVNMATAKYWFVCGVLHFGLYKSKKQVYVNMWHGDRGFKKVLNDKLVGKAAEADTFETKYCDLMTSGSDIFNRKARTAFRYFGKLLQCGSPRCDLLLKKDKSKYNRIKKELNIQDGIKVLLYAPTFRDNNKYSQKENVDIDRVLSCLEKKTSEEWICLGRFHPMTHGRNTFNNKKIIDVTDYFDMVDLLYISDVLLTDYSSSAGDFILKNKPVLIYQADRDDYVKNDRQFYFKIEDSPYWIAKSQEELENFINGMTEENVRQNCKDVYEFFGGHETGNAADSLIDYLMQKS